MEKTHSNPTQKIESKDHLQIFQEIVEKRRQQPEGAPTMEGINDLLQGLPKTVAKSLSAEIPRLKSLAKDDEAFRELFMGEANVRKASTP